VDLPEPVGPHQHNPRGNIHRSRKIFAPADRQGQDDGGNVAEHGTGVPRFWLNAFDAEACQLWDFERKVVSKNLRRPCAACRSMMS